MKSSWAGGPFPPGRDFWSSGVIKSATNFDTFVMVRPFFVILSLTIVLLTGCGGGGGGGGDSSGGGLGSQAPSLSEASLRIVFPEVASLSTGKVADYNLALLSQYESSATFTYQPVSELSQETRQLEYMRYFAISESTRREIARFRVVVTGQGMGTVTADFPVTEKFGVMRVPSGPARSVVIEALNASGLGLLKTVPIVLDLDAATTKELVGKGSTPSTPGVVPVEFTLVDNIAPVTIIYATNASAVEGPHRQAVTLVITNNEAGAPVFYHITEKDKPTSTLPSVTSTFVQATSTATVTLASEAVYLIRFYSEDTARNREVEQQRQVTVNFNVNPPVSSTDYPGAPYKFFTGAQVALSADVLPSQTAVVLYRIGGTGNFLETASLRDREQGFVVVGDGRVPASPATALEFRARVNSGSEELTARTTSIVLTDFSVGGQVTARTELSPNTTVAGGRTLFCDTDSGSVLKDTAVCSGLGKRVRLRSGSFGASFGVDFPCFTSQGSSRVVTQVGNCAPCSQPGVNCPN
jgi:hypothetical protein